ncbi:hypothetical protein Aab01nite_43010 [Paractinoplanes abujensis]|uniref:Uncharacterized protein n=1 Tax=Paractinoplanes abujensis TaxID=882441 RepID=A0A7W7G2V9_9ACTN|nr:hypothetical protein [Actinoplanes abujensis]MBB4694074.1 hypothetical protein [Actinoplanes abujensis]GID20711.1 hypothetical protein Aab01nite_43010 [Actinoplanes abujensis]
MAYTPDKPKLPETSDELRARIPGWGADLDPRDRPAVPREQFDPTFSGAHWEFPERQPELWPRERSIEHAFLTPVFGTSCPPKGLSGKIRRYSYARYSEARAAHWLLLLASDRVDAVESTLRSFVSRRPDNPVTETGVLADGPRGERRADKGHHLLDPVIVAAPWVLGAGLAYALIRRLVRQ